MYRNPPFHMICRDELQRRMLDSACNVFSVMADIALQESHETPDGQHESWVTALIGFEGAYSGLVALHCPEPLARRTAAGLLCAGEEPDMQDVFDAMGEIVNILGGDMKLYLDKGGRRVRLSTPTVFVREGDFYAEFQSVPDTVACTMAADGERLMISVQLCRGEYPTDDRRRNNKTC